MEKIVIVPHDKVVYPTVALIGAHVSGMPNFMTVSHCGSGGFKPPLICFPSAIKQGRCLFQQFV